MADKSDATVVANKRQPSKWLLVVMILILALLAGGAWWMTHREKPKPTSNVPQLSMEALSAEVTKKLGTRSYAEAIRLIQGQKTINEPATQLLLANVYATKKDYAKALTVYADLDKANKLDSHSAAAAGLIAEQNKDYKVALHYYRVAVQKLKGENPANDDEMHMLDAKVEELQKKQ